MNFFKRVLLDQKLKKALARNTCRLDSGIKALRRDTELTLEQGVKLHQIKILSRKLSIGAHTDIVSGCELHEVSSIGRYCSIARNVTIGQDRMSHPLSWLTSHSGLVNMRQKLGGIAPHHGAVKQTVIGHDVWIGMDVLILDGVSIGTGAVIGAQSLVNSDIPPYAIAVGSPARVVRYRFEQDVIEGLLASQWWNLPVQQLAQLPLEDPQALLSQLNGAVAADTSPVQVVIHSKPFAVSYIEAR
jgi:acetyltransferase-like isoleucine patch superfamily enzyme